MSDSSDQTVEWRPPRGVKTRVVAWLVLVFMGACLLLAIVGAVLMLAGRS